MALVTAIQQSLTLVLDPPTRERLCTRFTPLLIRWDDFSRAQI